jgi:uncharacterized membrane protein
MDTKPTNVSAPLQAGSGSSALQQIGKNIRNRMIEGLLFVLPIALTIWVLRWLYNTLEYNVIEPIARVVLWKIKWTNSADELPYWVENFLAPMIAILIILLAIYALGFFVHTRLRQSFDWLILRVPLVSVIYDSIRSVFQTLEKPREQQAPQRMVLVKFPHSDTKVPAFVTGICKDLTTQKSILCVYIPTTPMPTSGYFLLVPEDEVTELNWSIQETLQAIISGGLTTPPEVHYFKSMTSGKTNLVASNLRGDLSPPEHTGGSPLS